MELLNLLKPEAVKVVSTVPSKKRLLHVVGELANSVYGLDVSETVNALQERETLGPTGVGHGVALPHARSKSMESVVGTFILLEKPIDFGAVDNQPVDLVFSIFAPEAAGVDHLKALALVSRTLRDSTFCSKLRSNKDSATLYTILTASGGTAAA
tara:strand:- start:637 stop:1101 length:465 start_codon:yes stop_codon:yes gene_type:complete